MLAFVPPMLATPAPLPPDDGRWRHEPKWDGMRVGLYTGTAGEPARFLSRNGKDATVAYPELLPGAAELPPDSVLDGEVAVFDAAGRPDFGRLQHRMHRTDPADVRRAAAVDPVTLVLFDVVAAGGRLLVDLPWEDRRHRLEELVALTPFVLSPVFDAPARDIAEATRAAGLEGVVSKRVDARYTVGRRSDAWRKYRHLAAEEVVIGGWERGKDSELGALLLGVPSPAGLVFVGEVGSGLDDAARRTLLPLLREREQPAAPFLGATHPRGRDVHFARPDLVAEVRYAGWTPQGRLRQPAWRGLRPDKEVADVTTTLPAAPGAAL